MITELTLKGIATRMLIPNINRFYVFATLLCTLLITNQSKLTAQNDLACINHINFSLDATTCTGAITPEMILVGNETCATGFDITITDDRNRRVDNAFTIDDVGKTFTYEICCDDNCCWGTVTIEFKAAISVLCPADDTIPCATIDFFNFFEPVNTGCGTIEVDLLSQEKTHLECNEELTATVARTYRVSDNFGNTKLCQQTISLARINPSDILFPGNANVNCSDTTLVFDENGIPIPWLFQPLPGSNSTLTNVGLPLICGVAAPVEHFLSDAENPFGATISLLGDEPIPGAHFFCPGTGSGTGSGTGAFPLIPTGGAVLIVESGDVNDPDIDVGFFEDTNTPLFCNTLLTFTDVVFPPTNNGCTRKVARTWELREWWCTDELTTSSIQFIDITDDMAPEFICPADYTVSSNDGCGARITLPKINPMDQCSAETFVSAQVGITIVEGDGAQVELELGKNLVTFIVSDVCRNRATCTTQVTIIDRYEPVAICDPDKVVSLSTLSQNRVQASIFDNGSFDDCGIDRMEARRMDSACDSLAMEWNEYVEFCCEDATGEETMVAFRVVDMSGNQSICMVAVEVQNKLVPNLVCPEDVTTNCSQRYDINNLGLTFGIPVFEGACNNIQIPEETLVTDVNQCGIGTIERTFKFTDDQGNTLESCRQFITVLNSAPLTAANITWPQDYEENNACGGVGALAPALLPARFGFPTVLGSDGCNQLGFDFVDKVIGTDANSFSCVVIERTWTAVNWCSTINGQFEMFRIPEPQILRLRNTVAPVLDNNMSIVYDAHGSDCQSGQVLVTRSATDDCINGLQWEYTVRDRNGSVVTRGNEPSLNNSFPVGRYEVEWVVRDGCGNSDTDIQVLDVFDGTPPTPVCHNGLSAALVGDDTNGDGKIDFDSVELWASDFDAGSSPNCNNPIVFSFSPDTSDRVRIFDCTNRGLNEIRLYVTDVFTGAQDFCTGLIDIQGGTTCLDGNIIVVGGEVSTETNQMIEGVQVLLETNAGIDITDADGTYAFIDMPIGGDYQVIPQHNDDYLNGVSTIDIIMIQRHILGIEPLDSPYKLIAADIDNSQSINGIDLVELRKLVLGIYQELPQNESWRFISEGHTFSQPTNPWLGQIPEWYNIIDLSENLEIDFIGVKIGDVNSDVVVSHVGTTEQPSAALSFNVNPHTLTAGIVTSIPFKASNYSEIRGWQTTIEYDNDALEIISVNGDAIDLRAEHMYMGREGYLTLSYDGVPQSFSPDEVLFEIQVIAKADLSQEVFEMNSDLTKSEAYDKDFNRLSLNMNGADSQSAEILSLFPNPFVKEAELRFSIPEAGEVRFEFYDVDGKALDVIKGNFDRGINQLQLQRVTLETTGVVYLRMVTDRDITEYRMIVL